MAANLDTEKEKIRKALSVLYSTDDFLFHRNKEEGVCERCIGFRFALHLQNLYPEYYVDCDFDSSYVYHHKPDGTIDGTERHGKILTNVNGEEKGLYVDIIVHKRDFGETNDLICFELKKWNRLNTAYVAEDLNKLQQMTSDYGYSYGFHLIFGHTKEESKYTILQNGKIIANNELIFDEDNSTTKLKKPKRVEEFAARQVSKVKND